MADPAMIQSTLPHLSVPEVFFVLVELVVGIQIEFPHM